MTNFVFNCKAKKLQNIIVFMKLHIKKGIYLILILVLFSECQQQINQSDIAKLNGYWEIEKVVFKDGEDKDYKMNENFDYFQIKVDNTGFRKKVRVQFDGTFLVNNVSEKVKIRFQNKQVFIDYETPYMKWSEELLLLTDTELVLLNSEKKEYHYKETGPINLLKDGQKTK